jgi:hypothetical protein
MEFGIDGDEARLKRLAKFTKSRQARQSSVTAGLTPSHRVWVGVGVEKGSALMSSSWELRDWVSASGSEESSYIGAQFWVGADIPSRFRGGVVTHELELVMGAQDSAGDNVSSRFRGGVVTHELVMGAREWVDASGSEESSCLHFNDRSW